MVLLKADIVDFVTDEVSTLDDSIIVSIGLWSENCSLFWKRSINNLS